MTAPMRDDDREDLHDHDQRLKHLEEMVGEMAVELHDMREELHDMREELHGMEEELNGKLDTILHRLDDAQIGP